MCVIILAVKGVRMGRVEAVLDEMRAMVKSEGRECRSVKSLDAELAASERELDDGEYGNACFRCLRVLEWAPMTNLYSSAVRKYSRIATEILGRAKKGLEKEYQKRVCTDEERKFSIERENEKRRIEAERMTILASRKDSASRIRSTIGHNFIEKYVVNHPVTIVYTPNYRTWAMLSKQCYSSESHGMENLGNTCYINSVIQALNATSLTGFLLRKRLGNLPSHDGASIRLTCELVKVLLSLHDSSKKPVSTKFFFQALGEVYSPFKEYLQQDANEFYNVLLNSLSNGLNTAIGQSEPIQIDNSYGSDEELASFFWKNHVKNNNSEILNLFTFQERNAVKCPHCGQVYRSFNPSTGIEVQIPRRGPVCLEDCLAAYCREETLDENSLYACEKCNQKGRATQQLTFFSNPEILVITLKRFMRGADFCEKVSMAVIFQQEFDLSPFMCTRNQRAKYRLTAIVNHSGTLNGGHYTADIREKSGVWSHCSDENVSECTEPKFELAYILFYERIKSTL